MSLKELKPTGGPYKSVLKAWDAGCGERGNNFVVEKIWQVRPEMEVVETFEERRTELEKKAGDAFETKDCYLLTTVAKTNQIVKEGFQKTFAGDKVAFSLDPVTAVEQSKEVSYQKDVPQNKTDVNRVIRCRVSLGRDNKEQRATAQKYILEDVRGVIAAFIIQFTLKNDDANDKMLQQAASAAANDGDDDDDDDEEAEAAAEIARLAKRMDVNK